MKSKTPRILNLYKPKDMTSYDVVRVFKRRFGKEAKIGHFGTLDPFACGVLIIGMYGAQRINNYIHDCLPKSYIATGILGKETETGDLTVEPSQTDETEYFKTTISDFSIEFIQAQLEERFLGEYWQAPHKFSAAKFEGKALHKWAREGVEIKKEKKLRYVHKIEVLEYDFPKLVIRFEVSSGTYIRSLFTECAAHLGTLGTLADLEREEIGLCNLGNAIRQEDWEADELGFLKMDEILDFKNIIMAEKEANLFSNGVKLKLDRALREEGGSLEFPYRWVRNENLDILGLAEVKEGEIHSLANFSSI